MNYDGWQGNFLPNVAVTIAQGAQLSTPINVNGFTLAQILLPTIFTGTALTFYVGDSEDGFQARGQATFSGTTANNDTITINGVVITFKTVVVVPTTQVLIGGTAAETAQNLLDFLAATANASLLACTYDLQGAVLLVTAVVHGTAGNAYTFAKSSSDITLVPAGGTLAGGGFTQLYDKANAAVSMTVAQARAYAVDTSYFQGVSWLQIKSGSAEVAQRTLLCSLKGI